MEPKPKFISGEHFLGQKTVENKRKMGLSRCQQIKMTNEARVLHKMRLEQGLSMRQAGSLITLSDSYISHIETGRIDVPSGRRLQQLLNVYGITREEFEGKVQSYKEAITPKEELLEIVNRLEVRLVKIMVEMAKTLISFRAV